MNSALWRRYMVQMHLACEHGPRTRGCYVCMNKIRKEWRFIIRASFLGEQKYVH